jgi:hypothetical protein
MRREHIYVGSVANERGERFKILATKQFERRNVARYHLVL